MKKEYVSLEFEIVLFDSQDIVTASDDDVFGSDIFDD